MSRCLYLEYGAGCGCSECMPSHKASRLQCPDPGHPVTIAHLRAQLASAQEDAFRAGFDALRKFLAPREPDAWDWLFQEALTAYYASAEVQSAQLS